MGAIQQAWKDCPSDLQQFYVSWSDRNTRWCNPFAADPWPGYKEHFTTFGSSFNGATGYDIFRVNMSYQLFNFGVFDPARIELIIPALYWVNELQPPADASGTYAYQFQWDTIPTYATNYPRPKYRVRRSYWTGAPRQRRNL
jgi:hypothetical protein